jgi:hypothetical protein
LCPIKTILFGEDHAPLYHKYNEIKYKRRTTSNLHFWFQNYNYFHIDSCLIEDIKKTVEKFKTDIVQNRQYHLFYLLNTHRDIDYDKWKWIEHIRFNEQEYTVSLEVLPFGMGLKGNDEFPLQIAGTRRKIRKKGTRRKARYRSKNSWVFERSSFGMPIMYAK